MLDEMLEIMAIPGDGAKADSLCQLEIEEALNGFGK